MQPYRRHIVFFLAATLGLGVMWSIAGEAPPGMVSIPAGKFHLGCPSPRTADCRDNQRPAREVYLDAFYLDVHEVTVDAYAQCVKTRTCREPANKKPPGLDAKWARYDFAYNWGKFRRGKHPVNGVTWNDAEAYCKWRGKRLPTEAEFEKALRGTLEKKQFPWGDEPTPPRDFGNFADERAKRKFSFWHVFQGYDDGYVGTAPVCSFKKNPYGLCDIAGNVWEWCADSYQADWYQRLPEKNPVNRAQVGVRVVRGGGFRGTPNSAYAHERVGLPADEYVSSRGFRCAKSLN